MGVPLLLTWLRKRFSSCFLPCNGPAAEHVKHPHNLYIDLNSLLYQSAQIITSSGGGYSSAAEVEDAVISKLFELIDDLIFNVVGAPQCLVYLAVDGISPLGKLSQQRLRRRRSHRGHRNDNRGETQYWDNNCISVGTHFMAKVTDALHYYVVTRTERINSKRLSEWYERQKTTPQADGETAQDISDIQAVSFVVDDVLRPGEGENKIAEAIRRFRTQKDYNPNTRHIICSSDTDVTVSSLILHEPRIHVLRYEPSGVIAGKSANNNNNNTNNFNVVDTWNSTFFSVYQFRLDLQEILGLSTTDCGDISIQQTKSLQFEKTLHDVVFVMLLFGNDFLPECGGKIQEGTLDSLLNILAVDFASREMTIVDPVTNHIQFESARYLLACLSDVRGQTDDNPNGGLRIVTDEAGGGEHHGKGKRSGANWGFKDDPEFQEKQRVKEARMEKKCYCYWTMLQWALQYSGGTVEHWGCYYPFDDAPPLYQLRKYCGTMSYEGLIAFALSLHHEKLNAKAALANKGEVNSDKGKNEEKLPAVVEMVEAEGQEETFHSNAPTNVLVQLMVLLPSRSAQLLPLVIRNDYAEIEEKVQAPMEQLNLKEIKDWCQIKMAFLSREEQTRFEAYNVFSNPHISLAQAPLPAAEGGPCEVLNVKGNELVFAAYWDRKRLEEEVKETLQTLPLSASSAEGSHKVAKQETGSVLAAKAASFFGSRPAKSSSASAAAALLLRSAKTEATKDSQGPSSSASSAVEKASQEHGVRPLQLIGGRTFKFLALPLETTLPNAALAKMMGYIEGSRFLSLGLFCNSNNRHASVGGTLSSSATTHQVRMVWSLAVADLLSESQKKAMAESGGDKDSYRLLPGCEMPSEEKTYMQHVTQERNEMMGKRANKRERSSSPDEDGEKVQKNEETKETVETSTLSDIEKKKKEMQARLALLKSNLQKGN